MPRRPNQRRQVIDNDPGVMAAPKNVRPEERGDTAHYERAATQTPCRHPCLMSARGSMYPRRRRRSAGLLEPGEQNGVQKPQHMRTTKLSWFHWEDADQDLRQFHRDLIRSPTRGNVGPSGRRRFTGTTATPTRNLRPIFYRGTAQKLTGRGLVDGAAAVADWSSSEW